MPWLLRQWALRDAGRYSEVFGSPFRIGYTPMGADKEDKARFMRELAKIGTEATIRLPQADSKNTPGFDVKLIEATGKGLEGFMRLVETMGTNIAVTLLGQNLTTEIQGGSYAAAEVHKSIRLDIYSRPTLTSFQTASRDKYCARGHTTTSAVRT